jgi:hypothetical protein
VTRTRRRRIIIGLGAIAFLASLISLASSDELRYRWYEFTQRRTIDAARAQILGWTTSYAPAETLTGALDDLMSDGEHGFRAFASLLDDPEPKVWSCTAEVIDTHAVRAYGFSPESWSRLTSVLRRLRSYSRLGALKFLLGPTYSHWTDWRAFYFREEDDDVDKCSSRWYWSGKEGVPVPLDREILDFCEDLLFERVSIEGTYVEREEFQSRALALLSAMPIDAETRAVSDAVEDIVRRFLAARPDEEARSRALEYFAVSAEHVTVNPETPE